MPNPVFLALDTPDLSVAAGLARGVAPHVGGLKIGLEFVSAQGPAGIATIVDLGLPVFLDVKLHDIPATVAGAVRALSQLGVRYLTIHAGGGPEMVEAARNAAEEAAPSADKRIKLLAVTVLTSLDSDDLAAVGQDSHTMTQTQRLARLALANGADGLICSPLEVAALRREIGPQPVLMVPGIRPAGADIGDQKRILTPKEAIDAGATHLVIGRPITKAEDPVRAAEAIAESLAVA